MTDGSDYTPWIINKALSHHADTVFMANEASKMYNLPARLQYDFLKGIVRKRKRWAKWPKAEEHPDLDLVALYFGFSKAKAKEAMKVLTTEDLAQIREKLAHGGQE